jgi:tetratricopeptide (TPR) repeat protein
MAPRWLRALPLLVLGSSLIAMAPAQALVPYTYVPRRQELEGAGLGIAQAAARLLQLGQARDAARLAALTVQLLPADSRTWLLLAEAQLRSRQLKEAGVSLAKAKTLDPDNAGIWFAEASLALRDNRASEAIDLLNQPRQALTAFERATRLRKDFWEAINNQALVLYEKGETERAIERWRRVLEIKPDAAEPNLALAAALFQLGGAARQEALQRASQALDSEPDYVLDSYQKEQLWGPRLRQTTQLLLQQGELKADVDRAMANANPEEEVNEE